MMLGGALGGGHLGDRVSALVDDQLSPREAERAWDHVTVCEECDRLVQRETWLKSRLSAISAPYADPAPRADLLGALFQVDERTQAAWRDVDDLERRGRGRRAALTAVGVGSVSAAVLGLVTLTGSPAGLHERPVVRQAPARIGAVVSSTGSQARPTPGPAPVRLRGPAH